MKLNKIWQNEIKQNHGPPQSTIQKLNFCQTTDCSDF